MGFVYSTAHVYLFSEALHIPWRALANKPTTKSVKTISPVVQFNE